jgi:trehalose/maltose hydrolase-like predicted phosphorylase
LKTLVLLLLPLAVLAGSAPDRADGVYDRNCVSRKGPGHNGNKGSIYPTRFDGVTWDNTNWRVTTTTLDQGHYQSRGSIANGYLGISVASVGPFFEIDVPVNGDVINGWPLFSLRQSFATIQGFYNLQSETNGSNFRWMNQYGGESVISGVPHWSGLILDLGGENYLNAAVDASTISKFKSTLDFKGGVLTWEYTWTPRGGSGSFDIVYQLFAHKLDVKQAVVHMEITPSSDGQATVANVLDGYAAVRTDFVSAEQDGQAIFSSVRPTGISNVTAYIYAEMAGSEGVDMNTLRLVTDRPYVHTNDSSIAQGVTVNFRRGRTTRITKFIGGEFINPQYNNRWTN